MKKKIRILTIDGGGIRGLIPAVILNYIEEEIQKRTGNNNATLADYFDMIAGTSTGGILTCFYLLPAKDGDQKKSRYFAREAIELYKKYGKTIFKPKMSLLGSTIGQLFGEKYSEKGLEKILKEKMGNIKLSETRKRCLITAYDISSRNAVLFTTLKAQKSHLRNYYMRDIARATSAAPTYFKAANIVSMGKKNSFLIDGGMFANDPTMCALVEARKTSFPNFEGFPDIEDMYIVSIGTGKDLKKYDYGRAKNWGVPGWIAPIISIMMSSSAEVVSYQIAKLFEVVKCPECYTRIEPELGLANSAMDDVSDGNIAHLYDAAMNYIDHNMSKLNKIVKILLSQS